jgi:DNA repair protein RAD16
MVRCCNFMQDDGKQAFERLGILLDQIMIRRTKEEKADDLGLPTKMIEIRTDRMNEKEEDF